MVLFLEVLISSLGGQSFYGADWYKKRREILNHIIKYSFTRRKKTSEVWTQSEFLKFIYSKKATKFCEISTVDLTVTTVEISQKIVAFSEYMNFTVVKIHALFFTV